MISTPQISSPWMAALSQTTGPSFLPCTTISGRATGVPLIKLPMGSSMRMRFPALTLWPAISNAGRVVVRLARADDLLFVFFLVVDFFAAVVLDVAFLSAVALIAFFLVVGLLFVLFLAVVSLLALLAVDFLAVFLAAVNFGSPMRRRLGVAFLGWPWRPNQVR